MNWLLFFALMVYLCLGLLFVVIPIIALIHCGTAKHISPGKKILWFVAMVVFWGFGPLLYTSFASRNKRLEYLSIFGSALLLGILSLFLISGSGNIATNLKSFKAMRSPAPSKGTPLSSFGSVTVTEEAIGKSKIMRMDAPGNLESLNDLGCVELTKISNKITPADMFLSIGKCIQEEYYENAAKIYGLAGIYGAFDTFRVADQSAHQALTMLRMAAFNSVGIERGKVFLAAVTTMADNPEAHKKFCEEVNQIGPPDYFPRYMVQHGLDAFNSELTGASPGDPLVKGFDSKDGWEKSLKEVANCTVSIQGIP